MDTYAFELAATVGLEAPIVAALCARSAGSRALAAGACVNLASHPVASLCIASGMVAWGVAEALVVGFEALALQAVLELPFAKALGAAVIANAVTAGLAVAVSG